ncbi:hypothetical protein SAMN05660236_0472 [Ohtaekwangia koreensis]|uniref:Uncharacterized protein n=1 Tax=Ohtaekwangia koreensis TaxID=688867 RepID=A0A1T5IW86_9BACT|nr:hypothetical protein SAMN05660236_0472 [Ohtaekwangia koreensis]
MVNDLNESTQRRIDMCTRSINSQNKEVANEIVYSSSERYNPVYFGRPL